MPTKPKPIDPPKTDLPLRILAAVLGGYALCWAIFDLLCASLPFAKATVWYLTGQLAPLPFLTVLLWAFVASTPWRALSLPLLLAACIALPGVLS